MKILLAELSLNPSPLVTFDKVYFSRQDNCACRLRQIVKPGGTGIVINS